MIWVLDASVAIRWFLEEEADERADLVLERIVQHPGQFAVPELFAFETFAVLQRLHADPLRAFQHGILPLLQAGLFRQPMTRELAFDADRFVQLGLTGYDACYAALAESLEGVWLTFDEKAHRRIQDLDLSCLLSIRLPTGWHPPGDGQL